MITVIFEAYKHDIVISFPITNSDLVNAVLGLKKDIIFNDWIEAKNFIIQTSSCFGSEDSSRAWMIINGFQDEMTYHLRINGTVKIEVNKELFERWQEIGRHLQVLGKQIEDLAWIVECDNEQIIDVIAEWKRLSSNSLDKLSESRDNFARVYQDVFEHLIANDKNMVESLVHVQTEQVRKQ